jgi:hypothetical protein
MTYYSNAGLQVTRSRKLFLIVAVVAMAITAAVGIAIQTKAFTTTDLTLRPSTSGSAGLVGVSADSAPGFASGSFQSQGTVKSDIGVTSQALFGRDVALGEIASMSYWTKTNNTHVAVPGDWYINIYTNPYAGDASSSSWYGDRIGTEPYYSVNLTDPINTWNKWSTDGSVNQLRFFESTDGAAGANFGAYTDPVWSDFVTGNALSGQPYATRTVLKFTLQTGSGWVAGFTGKVDGLTVTLTDGSVGTVNLEADLAAAATTKADCMNGNWVNFQADYKNQGECVASVVSNGKKFNE